MTTEKINLAKATDNQPIPLFVISPYKGKSGKETYVLTGDTKPYANTLRQMRGLIYNGHLDGEQLGHPGEFVQGWICSPKYIEDLKKFCENPDEYVPIDYVKEQRKERKKKRTEKQEEKYKKDVRREAERLFKEFINNKIK